MQIEPLLTNNHPITVQPTEKKGELSTKNTQTTKTQQQISCHIFFQQQINAAHIIVDKDDHKYFTSR